MYPDYKFQVAPIVVGAMGFVQLSPLAMFDELPSNDWIY